MRTLEEALHAMQTGVAMAMTRDGGPERGDTSPKHLRVGVNSAMVQVTALVGLLAKKGVITLDEYMEELTAEMNRESDTYERELGAKLI